MIEESENRDIACRRVEIFKLLHKSSVPLLKTFFLFLISIVILQFLLDIHVCTYKQ